MHEVLKKLEYIRNNNIETLLLKFEQILNGDFEKTFRTNSFQ